MKTNLVIIFMFIICANDCISQKVKNKDSSLIIRVNEYIDSVKETSISIAISNPSPKTGGKLWEMIFYLYTSDKFLINILQDKKYRNQNFKNLLSFWNDKNSWVIMILLYCKFGLNAYELKKYCPNNSSDWHKYRQKIDYKYLKSL